MWRLATGNSYRSIAKTFAVGKSTAVQISKEFCIALVNIASRFICFPTSSVETGEAIENFKVDMNCKILQAFAAIDGTHIEIVAPNNDNKADYYTKRYTVNTQGIVGANLLFLHVATGYPGSSHDARVWRATDIFEKIRSNEILQYPEEIIENVRVKPLMLGDGAYPLSTYVMKPYPYSNALSREQINFNKKLPAARVNIERAFGIVKARWRILLKRLDSQITNVSDTILACFILHNFCQMQNDQYVDHNHILNELVRKERDARNKRQQNNTAVEEVNNLRNILKIYINNRL